MADIVLMLVLQDCGLHLSEAAAFVWSDIGRWDDGSSSLLIERSQTDQTSEGWAVFTTRRAITAPEELRQLRSDASQFVAPALGDHVTGPMVQHHHGGDVHPVAGMRTVRRLHTCSGRAAPCAIAKTRWGRLPDDMLSVPG